MSIMVSRFHLFLTLVLLVMAFFLLRNLGEEACFPNADDPFRCAAVAQVGSAVNH